jgi:deoxyribonuclease-1
MFSCDVKGITMRYIDIALLLTFSILSACQKSRSQQLPTRHRPEVFDSAKNAAHRYVYDSEDLRVTFYCGCKYSATGIIDASSCNYKPRKNAARGKRLEWEHVVPAHQFGAHRKCWKGCGELRGRECCRKTDAVFRRIEADLMNLVPSIGELNGDRSNRLYGEVDGEPRAYGACDFEIDYARDVAEPRSAIRGDIARIYFYMIKTYPGEIRVTKEYLALLKRWNLMDPVSAEETSRIKRIRNLQ